MKEFFRSLPRPVQGLLVLGVFAVILMSLLAIALLSQRKQSEQAATPEIPQGMMGQEGVACGGPERLPCQPGFVCDADDDAVYGTCVTDVRETYPLGKEGILCNTERGCMPGLVCNGVGGASGVCVKPAAQ